TPPPAPPPAAKPPTPAPAPVAKAPTPTPPPPPAQPPAQLSIFDEADEGIAAPDWLANLGVGNELPPEPMEAEPEPAAPSLSWLESLAVDSSSAVPDFDLSSLGKELEPIAEAPSTDVNPVNWLESLSQNLDDVVAVTPTASNPVNWLENLAQE